MVRSLLIRGLLAGLGAGLLAFAFAFVVGEPQVQHAIDVEAHAARLHHEAAAPAVVSRGVQRTVGLLAGTAVLGVALGGLLALVFAYAYGRVGRLGARTVAALLALGAFLAVSAIPFTKYPPDPPGVGSAATLDRRTVLFFAMIATSVLAALAAARVRRSLLDRWGAWDATIAAGVVLVAVVALAEVILPAVHETPAGFPADLLHRFRMASLGTSVTLWLALGLGFGAAAARLVEPVRRGSEIGPSRRRRTMWNPDR
jgi:predicted cobalt transporter CbtA